MRHALPFIPLVIMTTLTVSCTLMNREEGTEQDLSGVTEDLLNDSMEETGEAALAVTGYAYTKKAEYLSDMDAEMMAIQQELEQFGDRVESSSDIEKVDASAKLNTARKKLAIARLRFDLVKSATKSEWSEVKGGFDNSFGDLQDSVRDTRQWLSNKVAL